MADTIKTRLDQFAPISFKVANPSMAPARKDRSLVFHFQSNDHI